jgi:adenylate cyclase
VISAIHEAGGDVLKLIGDGVLAIFGGAEPEETCRRALVAEARMRERIAALAASRREEGRPTAGVNLGLHIGDVFYGNIGSTTRLDFTVIGPAVNEVSRIVALCRSVERSILLSSDFAAATPESERARLVSVGRFALRGVGRAQDLYTIDPALLDM